MNAAAIRLLAEKGMTASDIAEVAEALEQSPKKSSGAERQARYRARKKAEEQTEGVTSDVTGDVTDVTDAPLSRPPTSPPTTSLFFLFSNIISY